MLIRREISFFFSGWFSTENGRPGGRISDRIERPTVVSYSVIFGTNFGAPSLWSWLWTISVIRTLTRDASSTSLFSYARIASDTPVNIMPSPLPFTASRGRVVQTQHDILRRHDRRIAVRREQDVVRRQHQRARFHLRFERQRHVHGHLVTVEVGVERRANERVQLDRLTFDQHRLESLNTKTVQRRRTVQHDRMFANDFFQDVPHHRRLVLDHLLRSLDGGSDTHHFELVEDERLEQFERHQLRQTALMELQRRADHDHRTARVVNALTEQVLTETAVLTLDHVSERLQRTLVRRPSSPCRDDRCRAANRRLPAASAFRCGR